MKIWGVSRIGLDFALAAGSVKFDGNVKFMQDPRRDRRHWKVRLRHREPGPGSLVYTYNGYKSKYSRTGPAVCWHVHAEFMRAIFQINPKARIQTILADYSSRGDFETKHLNVEKSRAGRCNCKWD